MISSLYLAAGDLSSPPTDPWSLIQYGIVGFILACLMARKLLVPEWVLKRDEDRHAAEIAAKDERIASLEGQVERLQKVFQDQMIPALTRATEVTAKYNEELAHQRWSQGERA